MDKRFSGQEVFEMVWAVLDAIKEMQVTHPDSRLQPSVIADAVREELEAGASPVGLRVVPKEVGGELQLHWHGYLKKSN